MNICILGILLSIFAFQKSFAAVICKDSQALPDKNGICYCNYSYFGTPSGVNTQCTSCGGSQSSPYGSVSSLACITCPSDSTTFDQGSGKCLCSDQNAIFNYTADTCVCNANFYADVKNNNTCTPCPNGQTSLQGTQKACQGSQSIILIASHLLVCILMFLI
ncbi:zinc finger, LSD1 subclass family protein (macronuclear) [Tetrahymena thermophila SB210]|uniref:Zinc finger, LSD1 subclass family protein n=1 Tax=Tetrahymena thermophila (strain SB210) TaxID=312017 RepID=Q24CG1_TETTS|nr:zinc finger, LSD1 subclass family protein [Tetrahymena thermophila SB210]EAS05499.1 zinc finger, LSD1 subclass family protein [Tetrahymena thermophila SB210]|eukprot:XP_001025744.1 zinc finger, LSD1 subclass family protein [Tetrahymena thermophila SB210]